MTRVAAETEKVKAEGAATLARIQCERAAELKALDAKLSVVRARPMEWCLDHHRA